VTLHASNERWQFAIEGARDGVWDWDLRSNEQYSSLAYLKQFDIDYLKIDRTFIRDIEKNECSRAIAESIIAMAHRLGLKVIAEGIEKPEQEAVLRSAGCDYGQGFLFSAAILPQAFEQLLTNQENQIE
jgi:EAL domain-containing protein (putative c-di-GMP-specific phosphodiesterase class I)